MGDSGSVMLGVTFCFRLLLLLGDKFADNGVTILHEVVKSLGNRANIEKPSVTPTLELDKELHEFDEAELGVHRKNGPGEILYLFGSKSAVRRYFLG